jgi:hypothetical protein
MESIVYCFLFFNNRLSASLQTGYTGLESALNMEQHCIVK